MKEYNIVIIGAGQIGRRHLQAIARTKLSVSIEVVGRSLHSLTMAKECFEEIPNQGVVKNVAYLNSITDLSEPIDVGIIATNSDVRRKVVEELINSKRIKYLILEKIVFQSDKDFQDIITLLEEYQVKAWVNCSRRMLPFFKRIKESVEHNERICLHVQGGNWGLACNSIHFIDLLGFLSGDNDFYVNDSSRLDSEIYESKRKGFLEFSGMLSGHSRLGNEFSLISKRDSNAPVVVNILGENAHFIIFEDREKSLQAHKLANWRWEEVSFKKPYQSHLTHLVVEQILEHGQCDLTSLEVSYRLHKPLLKTFLQHLEKTTGKKYEQCPVT
jgi:predicted dehydrogenase